MSDYNMYVKEKLIEWRDNFEKNNHVTLNYTAIANTMQEHFNITTSPQKIAAMFNSQSRREIKLQELVALAQIFNIALWDLCQYPNNPSSGIDAYKLTKNNKLDNRSIHELNNKYYFTDEGEYYYCYYFRPKHFQNQIKPVETTFIKEAKMSISLRNGHTVIELEEINSNTTFYGHSLPSFTLSGNLYHFENTDIAYSFIIDSSGKRAMALMFSFLNISSDIRHYIPVGMMTFSIGSHEPLFQKMAVFRVRQNYQEEKTSEILKGILLLDSSPLIIDEETVNKLKENEMMNKVLSEAQSHNKYYVYNEAILRNSFLIPDNYQKMQLLFQLRKNSLYPIHEIISESESFTEFIKQYQLSQLRERQKECDKSQ